MPSLYQAASCLPLKQIIRNTYKLNLMSLHVFFIKKTCRGIDNPLFIRLVCNDFFSKFKIERHFSQCIVVLFVNQINRLFPECADKELLFADMAFSTDVFV